MNQDAKKAIGITAGILIGGLCTLLAIATAFSKRSEGSKSTNGQQAAVKKPSFDEVVSEGTKLLGERKIAEAYQKYHAAAALAAPNPLRYGTAKYGEGVTLTLLGRDDEAVQAFIDYKHAGGRDEKAASFKGHMRELYDRAVSVIEQKKVVVAKLNEEAYAAYMGGRYAEAREKYSQVVADPEGLDNDGINQVRLMLGCSQANTGQTEAAKQTFFALWRSMGGFEEADLHGEAAQIYAAAGREWKEQQATHLARLRANGRALGLDVPKTKEEVEAEVHSMILGKEPTREQVERELANYTRLYRGYSDVQLVNMSKPEESGNRWRIGATIRARNSAGDRIVSAAIYFFESGVVADVAGEREIPDVG